LPAYPVPVVELAAQILGQTVEGSRVQAVLDDGMRQPDPGVELSGLEESIGRHVRHAECHRVDNAALKRGVRLGCRHHDRYRADLPEKIGEQPAGRTHLETAHLIRCPNRRLREDVVGRGRITVGQIHAHPLVLALQIFRIQLLRDERSDTRILEEKRQLQPVGQVEAARLVGRVGVRVIRDPGGDRLEPIERSVQQPVDRVFPANPSPGLARYDLAPRDETLRVEPVGIGHMRHVPEEHGPVGPPRSPLTRGAMAPMPSSEAKTRRRLHVSEESCLDITPSRRPPGA